MIPLMDLGGGSEQFSSKGEDGLYDGQLFSRLKFVSMIEEHNFIALECLFLGSEYKILEKEDFSPHFNLDLGKLRRYVSENSSYSWVRAKKKLIVEKDFDPYRARKTLWHTFRVIDYGKQIGWYFLSLILINSSAINQKIVDFQSCLPLFLEITSNPSENWKDYEQLYKKKFNAACTDFRTYAPLKQ